MPVSSFAKKRYLIGFVLFLGGILAFGAYISVQEPDFLVYYSAAKQLLAHEYDLYRQGGLAFRYAPAVAFAFVPFSLLPPQIAAFLWYLLKVAALVAIVRMTTRLMALKDPPFWKILGFSFFVTGGYIVEELRMGNIHILVLFFIVLALYYAKRGGAVVPSFLLAAAVCVKITPVLVIAYFALVRRWKLCLYCILWLIVLVLSPALYLGWEENIGLAKTWITTAVTRGEDPVNHSLRGVLFKYLGENPITAETEKYPAVNLASWPPRLINGILILASLALLVLLGKALVRTLPDEARTALQYALLVTSLLILSPHNTRIYFSALFFPIAVLAAFVYHPSGRSYRTLLFTTLGLSFVLNTFLPALLPGRQASLVYETLSPYFFSALLVWIALFILIGRTSNRKRTPAAKAEN
jgi:hypothetical protein